MEASVQRLFASDVTDTSRSRESGWLGTGTAGYATIRIGGAQCWTANLRSTRGEGTQ